MGNNQSNLTVHMDNVCLSGVNSSVRLDLVTNNQFEALSDFKDELLDTWPDCGQSDVSIADEVLADSSFERIDEQKLHANVCSNLII